MLASLTAAPLTDKAAPLTDKAASLTAAPLTVHAKNLSGEILSMEVSSQETPEFFRIRLAERVCPDDPSRLVLLGRTRRSPVLQDALTEEALSNLLEELHLMAEEKQDQDEEGDEEEDEEWGEWQDGDMVEYLVQDPDPICIHLSEGIGALYDGYRQDDPFYPMYIHVRQEGSNPLDAPLYEYCFLFHLRTGTFHPSSAWEIQEDDMYSFIVFHTRTSYPSIQEMLMEEAKGQESIPPRYLERMCRAVDRKWIRILRRMTKFSTKWQRRARRSPKNALDTTTLWKTHYWAAKEKTRPMDRHTGEY